MIEAGEQAAVQQTRHVFQQAMRQRFSDAVEEIMERKVIAFMSQVHFDPDLAAEIFVLEQREAEPASSSRDGRGG